MKNPQHLQIQYSNNLKMIYNKITMINQTCYPRVSKKNYLANNNLK